MNKIVLIIGILHGLAVTSVAQSASTNSKPTIANPNASIGGTYTISLDAEPSGLNPLKGNDGYSSAVTGYAFDSLLNRNIETFELEPALAESYEVAKDGLSIKFILREGAKFHDGSPVTIEDVKFSFDVSFDPKLSDALRKMYFENFERAEILDSRTIRFVIKTKYFKNVEIVGGMEILPKAIYGDPKKKVNKLMVGSGAYKLEKYDQGQKIVLTRNPDWWGWNVPAYKGFNNFNKIVFRFIKDRTAQLESLKKGDIDMMSLTPEIYEKKTDGPIWGTKVEKVMAENSSAKATFFVAFNTRRAIFKDKEVRHAMSLLFNREFMIQKFFYGKYSAATGPWYQQSPYADPKAKAVPFDPQLAKAKLKVAGWTDSDKDGLLDKMIDGKLTKFSVELLNPGADWERYLTVYKEDLKKVGIEIQLKQMEWNAFQKTIQDGNFDLVALVFGGVVENDPKQIWHTQSISKEGSNMAAYSNPTVDKLIDEARAEMNFEKRKTKMQKIYNMIADDHPFMFLFNPKYSFYAHSKRIQKIKPAFKYGIGTDTWWAAP